MRSALEESAVLPIWLWLLMSHWMPEVAPAIGMVILLRALCHLKLPSHARLHSISRADAFSFAPHAPADAAAPSCAHGVHWAGEPAGCGGACHIRVR